MDARSKLLPVAASSSSLSPEENASSIIRRGTLAAGMVGVSSSSSLSLSGDAFRDMEAKDLGELWLGVGGGADRQRSAQTMCYVSIFTESQASFRNSAWTPRNTLDIVYSVLLHAARIREPKTRNSH